MKRFKNLMFIIPIFSVMVQCKKNDDNPGENDNTQKAEVIKTYANIVYQNYLDSYNAAVKLQTAVKAFVASPSQEKFEAAKKAWKDSREPYGQTEAFRFADGPIDDDGEPEALLNSWPLDEFYIDYVWKEDIGDGTAGNDHTVGIINVTDEFPNITEALLSTSNQKEGEEDVSTGYHAIEFLLWGQDLSDPLDKQAGKRPYTDFVVGEGGTAKNQQRRGQYISICADLIVKHLKSLVDEWKEGGNYRNKFLKLKQEDALKNIFRGIATLSKSELAGERIHVAYDNKDQEDEHSCFSDNTHRDTRLNIQGVKNVYTGTYGTIRGTSLKDLVNEANPKLGEAITALLDDAVAKVNATAIPFDFAISDDAERPKVRAAVNVLRALGDKFVLGAKAIGLGTVSTELPE